MNIISSGSSSTIIKSSYEIESRPISDLVQDRVLPRQLSTGSMRGQQTILGADGSKIVLGLIPDTDNEFGISFFDRDGNVVKKITALTDYIYDASTGDNVYQAGKLPDDTYGVAGANEGFEVEEGFE